MNGWARSYIDKRLKKGEAVNEDNELFRQQLDGVKPLKKAGKVQLKKTIGSSMEKSYAREAAVSAPSSDMTFSDTSMVSDDYVDWLKPSDILSFKRTGVQEGVFRKLRLGKYALDGRLDLHRMTVAEARKEVFGFIGEAMNYDLRTIIILHGKGERNAERQAILKSYVAKWLKELPCILAYHSAIKQHGGTGAVYALLKKSENLKAKNREQHGSRS